MCNNLISLLFQSCQVHRGGDRALLAERDAGGGAGPRRHVVHLEVLLQSNSAAQVQRAAQQG